MTEARDFVSMLNRAAKSQQEIKPLVENASGDKKMPHSQVYSLFKL
jgi:hypothetical protein